MAASFALHCHYIKNRLRNTPKNTVCLMHPNQTPARLCCCCERAAVIPKLDVAGSNPVSRSRINKLRTLEKTCIPLHSVKKPFAGVPSGRSFRPLCAGGDSAAHFPHHIHAMFDL